MAGGHLKNQFFSPKFCSTLIIINHLMMKITQSRFILIKESLLHALNEENYHEMVLKMGCGVGWGYGGQKIYIIIGN